MKQIRPSNSCYWLPIRSQLIGVCFSIGLLIACDNNEQKLTDALAQARSSASAADYAQALKAYQNVLSINPSHVDALFQSAEILVKLAEWQKAAEFYQTLVTKQPEHLMARVGLGRIFLKAGQLNAAEIQATEASALDSENPDVCVFMAEVLAAKNNIDAAFIQAEKALLKRPGDVSAVTLLANLEIKSGKWDKATEFLHKQIEQWPDNNALRLLLVNLSIKTQAYEQAFDQLEAIVNSEPKTFIHRQRLAKFLIEQNQLDKAETVLRTAIRDLPESRDARLELLDFLVKTRSPEVAEAEVIPMLEDYPDDFVLKFGLVNLYLTQNALEKAENALREIVQLERDGKQAVKAQIMLAQLQAKSNRLASAKKVLQDVLRTNPDEADALILRAEWALTENLSADAIADFRKVLIQQPENVKVLKLLSTAYQLNQDPISALENLQHILKLLPADEGARLDLAELLLKTGQANLAISHINTLLQQQPGNKKAQEALFKIYLTQKQWSQAQDVAKLLQQNYPENASGYYLAGLAYQSEGKIDAAISSFAEALSHQGDAIEPLVQIVNSYLLLNKPEQALNLLQTIIKQQPNHFVAYNLMGSVFIATHKAMAAVNAFNKTIEIKPEWEEPYRNLASIFLHGNERNKAVSILQQGVNKTNSPILVRDLAAIYHLLGAYDKARAILEDNYKKQPHSADALNNLVRYLVEQAKDNETLGRVAELAEPLAKTGNPDKLYTLAVLAYRQDSYEKAKQLLVKIIDQLPDSMDAHYLLGMVYYRQANFSSARKHLEHSVNSGERFNGIEQAREVLDSMPKNIDKHDMAHISSISGEY